MENILVGRKREQEILKEALTSREPELVAVIGRRRVGKTFLVRTVYDPYMAFEVTGLQNATQKKQLEHFTFWLDSWLGTHEQDAAPENWLAAFQLLIRKLERQPERAEKRVLFFDELPWLDSRKSGFLEAFGMFWNSWASRKNVIVVICGSAASWMIRRVVDNKGGLHNRITRRIHLQPFSLYETETYLNSRNIKTDRYQILHLYMALGGIPHYLKEVRPGLSAAQNIEQICFSPQGLLREEFTRLYPALFENSDSHVAIIRTLASSKQGLSRKELISLSKLPDGGSTNRYLDELLHSGFITIWFPLNGKKKEALFRLNDEFSLFYLQFMENRQPYGPGYWNNLSQTQQYASWSGYAFENICLNHIAQIKKSLGIFGVYTQAGSFRKTGKGGQPGVQIDLLLDRNDNIVNLCELKFYKDRFSLDAAVAQQLRQKVALFQTYSKTRKMVLVNLITTYGLIPNEHSIGLVDKTITMDALFLPVEEEY